MCVFLPNFACILVEPRKRFELPVVIAETEICLGSSATRIFPFSFRRQFVCPSGWQAAGLYLTLRECPAELRCLVPTQMGRRIVGALFGPFVVLPRRCSHY